MPDKNENEVVEKCTAKRFEAKKNFERLENDFVELKKLVDSVIEKIESFGNSNKAEVSEELLKRIDTLEKNIVVTYADNAVSHEKQKTEMTVDDLVRPIPIQPAMRGLVPVDQNGNIPKDWRKNKDVYEKVVPVMLHDIDGTPKPGFKVVSTEKADVVDNNISQMRAYIEQTQRI